MRNRRIITIIAMFCIVIGMAAAANAAEEPAPYPSAHTDLLTKFVPELMELPSEQWLMTGYRFYYDVYYYDENDDVVSQEMMLFDVVGKGSGHMVTAAYSLTFSGVGEVTSFELVGYTIDYPGVGEFWISLDAFRGKDAPATRDDVFSVEQYTWNDKTEDTWHAYLMSEDSLTDYEYFYSMEDGLMLSLDVFEYDEDGNYLGGSAMKYYDYFEYSAPWLDYGLSELAEGRELVYDVKATSSDGKVASGIMYFKPTANHSTWVELSQVLKSVDLGDTEGVQFVSEMCIDGLIMWLPAESMEYIEEGDFYFDDIITDSYVIAGGLSTMEGFGEVREINFKNGYFEADSFFREEDGVLVRYLQHASDVKPYQLELTLKEIR